MLFHVLIAVESQEDGQQRVKELAPLSDRIYVMNIVTDSSELFSVAKQTCPDIIIADTMLEDTSSLPVLLNLRKQGLSSHILLLSRRQVFEEAYMALRCHVDDFLLYPVNADRLAGLIRNILDELDSQSINASPVEYRKVIGRLFLDRGRITVQENHFPVEIVNSLYDTHFQNDSYRMVVIFMNQIQNISYERVSELLNSCTNIVYHNVQGLCYEIIMRFALKRVHVLLNYSADKDAQILSLLQETSKAAHGLLPGGTSVAFCCSNRHDNIQDIEELAEEAMDSVWLSYTKPADTLILKSQSTTAPESVRKRFDAIETELKRACYELNLKEFQTGLSKLFSLPYHMLKRCELRHLLRRVEYYMIDTNRELIASYADVNIVKQNILQTLQMSNSLNEYMDRYSACLSSVFRNILAQTGGDHSKYIRLSKQYIMAHLSSDISLKEAAESVGLSPNYYSTLFKKETGCTFSDFVNECRINEAKKLLADNTMKIKSIAVSLGFCDSRYFSRVFKNTTGMKPSEFRAAANKKDRNNM